MTIRAGSLTMDSDFCTKEQVRLFIYSKNKKQEIGHLLFPPQKGTRCQLARKNINTFHPLSCSFFFKLAQVTNSSKLSKLVGFLYAKDKEMADVIGCEETQLFFFFFFSIPILLSPGHLSGIYFGLPWYLKL